LHELNHGGAEGFARGLFPKGWEAYRLLHGRCPKTETSLKLKKKRRLSPSHDRLALVWRDLYTRYFSTQSVVRARHGVDSRQELRAMVIVTSMRIWRRCVAICIHRLGARGTRCSARFVPVSIGATPCSSTSINASATSSRSMSTIARADWLIWRLAGDFFGATLVRRRIKAEHLAGLVELEAMPDTRLKRIIEHTKVPIYAAAV